MADSDTSIIPYHCVFVDADYRYFWRTALKCLKFNYKREELINGLQLLWTNQRSPHKVLPCLSVRTGLDLYLRTKNFPPGSEVIMSAINIPDMIQIVHHHNLKIVSLDISIESASPKMELLESLISEKTVAVMIAHLYGKWVPMEHVISLAHKHNLCVIEDCAEGFSGFERVGHAHTDLALFSFGVIKFYTSFGGAIARVRDPYIYKQMAELHDSYPIQSQREYLKKITKYFLAYVMLNRQMPSTVVMSLGRMLNIDHKNYVVAMLRGFPSGLVERIRQRPSSPLLYTMLDRQRHFSESEFDISRIKGDYAMERLPDSAVAVGSQNDINNYWLFPIVVDNPDTVVKMLNTLGIDAYRGASQLNLVEPDGSRGDDDLTSSLNQFYPAEAKYLIDHIVYLPINKNVPFHILDQICRRVSVAIKMSNKPTSPQLRLKAKL
ncbi:hypothetical protein ScPMuIL_017013 [Solemya velum]